jgi:hypothetical protein
MKKVLIITYYWPPCGGGGVQRWLKFVKYLREYGWEPVVFTPENPECPSVDDSLLKDVPEDIEIIRNKIWEPYSFYKKLTGKKAGDKIQAGFLSEKKTKSKFLEQLSVWIRGNLFIPDARKFWIKPSVKFLAGYLKDNPVDLIVSTGPPHSAHMIAMGLKERFNIKWLADFRDPWTNIDFYKDLKLGKRADKVHHQLEEKVLQSADSVVVISKGMKEDFRSILNRHYEVIPNGFDPDDASVEQGEVKSNGKFSLSHIGSLTKTRNPENLWRVLSDLVKEVPDFARNLEIRNVGKIDYHAVEAIKSFGLEPYLTTIPYLSHEEVVKEQRSASVLLLLVNRTPNAKLIVTGKIFEYLISKRPIICIGPPDGDAATIINETKCGEVFDFDEIKSLKKYLLEKYNAFKANDLINSCVSVDRFNRKNLTEKLASVFENN